MLGPWLAIKYHCKNSGKVVQSVYQAVLKKFLSGFEFIELWAMKRGCPKTTVFNFLELENGNFLNVPSIH